MRLRRDASAPGLARRALERLDAISPVHDDALLVASELATEAVRQATVESAGEIELSAELVHDGLRIVVTHSARPELTTGLEPAEAVNSDGLGLRIIQGVARRWGTERFDGRRTWAVLSI